MKYLQPCSSENFDVYNCMSSYLNSCLVSVQFSFQTLMLLTQVLHASQVFAIILRACQQLFLPGQTKRWKLRTCQFKCWHDHSLTCYSLDPGLLVIHIPVELVQSIGLVQFLVAIRCHVLHPEF